MLSLHFLLLYFDVFPVHLLLLFPHLLLLNFSLHLLVRFLHLFPLQLFPPHVHLLLGGFLMHLLLLMEHLSQNLLFLLLLLLLLQMLKVLLLPGHGLCWRGRLLRLRTLVTSAAPALSSLRRWKTRGRLCVLLLHGALTQHGV